MSQKPPKTLNESFDSLFAGCVSSGKLWDNRCTMHRAREYDETQVRDMRRTTVSDGVPTVPEQAAA
jgi:alpha-ketoglutarate-dependent taurine dioxygenase